MGLSEEEKNRIWEEERERAKFRRAAKTKNKKSRLVGCFLVFFVIGLLIIMFASNAPKKDQPQPPSLKELARKNLTLDFKWVKGGAGSIMLADFTIINQSQYGVKDVKITCEHFGPSGTQIDSSTRTIFESIQPKKTREFKRFNMGLIPGQPRSTSCTIVDFVAF